MNFSNRRDIVFLVLAGFFITNAIMAELIGGKLIQFFGLFTQSIGIILWPIIFILTDLINEHFGKDGVKKLTYITVGLISFAFIVLSIPIFLSLKFALVYDISSPSIIPINVIIAVVVES